jgi:hypothetical protein
MTWQLGEHLDRPSRLRVSHGNCRIFDELALVFTGNFNAGWPVRNSNLRNSWPLPQIKIFRFLLHVQPVNLLVIQLLFLKPRAGPLPF